MSSCPGRIFSIYADNFEVFLITKLIKNLSVCNVPHRTRSSSKSFQISSEHFLVPLHLLFSGGEKETGLARKQNSQDFLSQTVVVSC